MDWYKIFTPTVMMLKANGYSNYKVGDFSSQFVRQNKKNKAKNRHVYAVGDYFCKVFEESRPVITILNNIKTGYNKKSSPNLLGMLFDGEMPVGYITKKCTNLHITHLDRKKIRIILEELLLETGLGIHDFHIQNFGRWNRKLCLLDLEAVRPWTNKSNSKDLEYNKFANRWFYE